MAPMLPYIVWTVPGTSRALSEYELFLVMMKILLKILPYIIYDSKIYENELSTNQEIG